MLSPEEARAYYDRFGRKQDGQAFYEDPATTRLIEHARFDEAHAILEFGVGTGRFAETVLSTHAPAGCRFRGIDISPTMVALAKDRLRGYEGQTSIEMSHGETRISANDGIYDRFVTNYVLDLMSENDAQALVNEAHRVLTSGGLLCMASLTHGKSLPTRIVSSLWYAIYRLDAKLVGGCRPIELSTLVRGTEWHVEHCTKLSSFGLTSEVLIARKLG